MSKCKDFMVLKAPMMSFCKSCYSENNNIGTYLISNLKKIGISKFEFIYKWRPIYNWRNNNFVNEIKILIPHEFTEDSFIRLLNLIEGLNHFILNNELSVWDNLFEVKKRVKIDF